MPRHFKGNENYDCFVFTKKHTTQESERWLVLLAVFKTVVGS